MDYGGVTDSVVMDETDSHLGDTPALVSLSTPSIRTYLACECLIDLSQRGTVTSDHVIRFKHFGMILGGQRRAEEIAGSLAGYATRYKAYFDRNAPNAPEEQIMLDPLPRAVHGPGFGPLILGFCKGYPFIANLDSPSLQPTSMS